MLKLDSISEDRIARHNRTEDRMALSTKSRKGEAAEPEGLVVALDSFFCDLDGEPHQVTRGDRLRPDHPVAVAHASLFAPDGLDRDELVRRRLALGTR